MKNFKNFVKVNESSDKYQDELAKMIKIIKSCESVPQLNSAEKSVNLWKNKWESKNIKSFDDDLFMLEDECDKKLFEWENPELYSED